MNTLILSIITMGTLGAVFAYGLSVARNKLKVEEDPRIDQVEGILPGANCGGCGLAGCRALAEAIVLGRSEADACPVGGSEMAREIAGVMGLSLQESEKKVAVLMCRGDKQAAADKGAYQGVQTCYAARLLQSGQKACRFGCLGYGDCVEVCHFDALVMGENGLPVVDEQKCTSCGLCVKACPNKLFEIHPVSRSLFVFCKSLDDARTSRQACRHACIACKICEKGFQNGEVKVENNLSVIHRHQVLDNEEGMKWIAKCPTKAIGLLPR